MSVSLLMALLPSEQTTPEYQQSELSRDDRDLRGEYNEWHGDSAERQALMLQALYDVLYGYTKMGSQDGNTVGTLLARAVSRDTTPPNPAHVQALRRMLKKELQEKFDKELKVNFPSALKA